MHRPASVLPAAPGDGTSVRLPRRNSPIWLALALALLTGGSRAADATPADPTGEAPLVATASGPIVGLHDSDLDVFRGIPYAAPPVGDRRWRAPGPVESWTKTRAATTFAPACMQPAGLSAVNGGDPGPLAEDCLYLNVWTPRAASSAPLPVLVWIHGGAYLFGAGSLPVYDGAALARRGVVVVTINYRLGALGFFAHPGLFAEDPYAPSNFGLLDQIAALTWVRANVAAFGGDPGNVTLLGQSAGAKSVLALFASPLARGLFHRGLAMSTYALPDATREQALAAGGAAATALGLDGERASATALRALPAERLAELRGPQVSTAPLPVAGDAVLPCSIQDTFAAHDEAPVPLVLGSTSDDASVVAAFGLDPLTVLSRLRAAHLAVKALYRGLDEREQARQATRDLVFTMPVRWIAERHSRRAPTWRYFFAHVAAGDHQRFAHGVPHGEEIAFFLDNLDAVAGGSERFSAADRRLASRLAAAVVAFAQSGRPVVPGVAAWPSDSAHRDVTLVLGDGVRVERNFLRARLATFMTTLKLLGSLLARGG